jgi:hypothetical protein
VYDVLALCGLQHNYRHVGCHAVGAVLQHHEKLDVSEEDIAFRAKEYVEQ